MTHSRSAKDEELMVSEVEVTTLPQASEPTTDPSESDGGGEEEQVKWQGGPEQPRTGSGGGDDSGSGGSGTGTGGGSGS
ncbi:MAG TPA: hypothetical protein VGM53_13300 [Streptosporangiaceae bacterium]|jgi:hypothetical protein